MQRKLTIAQYMREFSVKSPTTVYSKIKDGSLKAIDLNPNGKRPNWRIVVEDYKVAA